MLTNVRSITAVGLIDGQPKEFKAIRDSEGFYVLGKVIGRAPGSRPNEAINKVQVNTLEEAADLLLDTKDGKPRYYIWLTYEDGKGIRRRNQYSPKRVHIDWQ